MLRYKTALCFLLWSLIVATSHSQQPIVPHLEEPSGPYKVGRVAFDWIDEHRREFLSDDRRAHRELMVYLCYPAAQDSSSPKRAPLLPGAKQIDQSPGVAQMKDAVFNNIWRLVVSNDITSHAIENAPVAKNTKSFPVVLFSHGGKWSSFGYTSLIEDITSHGYIVAAIEYTYEAAAVAFPDDRVSSYSPKNIEGMNSPAGTPDKEVVRKAMTWIRERVNVMANDQRFVLDELSELNLAAGKNSLLAGMFDLSRVAAIGHSMGGQASVRACQLDDRIRACGNLDGGTVDGIFLKYPKSRPLSQPFLYVEVPFVPFSEEQLTKMKLTRDEWRKQWAATVGEQFRISTHEGYYVVLEESQYST